MSLSQHAQPFAPPGVRPAVAAGRGWLLPAGRSFGAIVRWGLALGVVCYLLTILAALAWMALGSAQEGWSVLLRDLLYLLFVPALPLLVIALLLRVRLTALALLPPLILLFWLLGPPVPSSAPGGAAGPSFRVLTLNTGAARGYGHPGAVRSFIEASVADLVCLVEARPDTLTTVGSSLLDRYPYQTGSGAVFVLSRFPLSDARSPTGQRGAKGTMQATVEIDRRLVDLIVVHLQRPGDLPGLRAGLGPMIRTGRYYNVRARDDAVRQLLQTLRSQGGPQLLVGDFNMTPTSAAYTAVTAELQDAFRAAGWGLGHTYPTSTRIAGLDLPAPFIRIDYIFHSPDLQTVQAWVRSGASSDHLAVLADLAIR